MQKYGLNTIKSKSETKKSLSLIIIIILIIVNSPRVLSGEFKEIPLKDPKISEPQDIPSSYDSTSWTPQGFSSPQTPPNPIQIRNKNIKDYTGLTVSGNRVHVSSASEVFEGDYDFKNVLSTDVESQNNKLIYAQVTSATNNNILKITNPLDPIGAEKINVYLNASQTMIYNYANNKVTLTIPKSSFANISKGSKSILVQATNSASEFTIEKNGLQSGNLIYDVPEYTIENANLTYAKPTFKEVVSTKQKTSVRIDFDKGFGYLALNGQIGISPGDSYQYFDLVKKENSYSLYNNGNQVFKYGFLKAGFLYDFMGNI